jgi:hypothetical protein
VGQGWAEDDGVARHEPASADAPAGSGERQVRARGDNPSDGAKAAGTVAGLAFGQLGAITALAYYFGWARAQAFLRYFGLDTSTVDFSTTDYVLRSVSAAYWPLMVLGTVVVLALALHPRIRTALERAGSRRGRYLDVAAAVGVGMLSLAVAGLYNVWVFPRSIPVVPLLLTAGIAVVGYSWFLRWPGASRQATDVLRKAQLVALAGLIAGGLFWTCGSYATTVGETVAREYAEDLPYEAEVLVFSAQRLGLKGPGVQVDPIGDEASVHRFRYTGLRLLLRSGDRYFLLGKDWRPGHDSVFVLSESDTVRLEFLAPPPDR